MERLSSESLESFAENRCAPMEEGGGQGERKRTNSIREPQNSSSINAAAPDSPRHSPLARTGKDSCEWTGRLILLPMGDSRIPGQKLRSNQLPVARFPGYRWGEACESRETERENEYRGAQGQQRQSQARQQIWAASVQPCWALGRSAAAGDFRAGTAYTLFSSPRRALPLCPPPATRAVRTTRRAWFSARPLRLAPPIEPVRYSKG